MAGRQRDQERPGTERQHEYFLPGDGILREVIQADICRYLGNDALVRPGVYQGRQGYFIRGYRNLTSEMISDLKEDSRRWANERTHLEQRYPYAQAPSYLSSSIHGDRQQSGPTPDPMNSTHSMAAQQQYGGQQYGGNQGGMIPQQQQQQQYGAQPQYGAQSQYPAQPQPLQDIYAGQGYTHATGPPNVSYPTSSVSYSSFDSNYQTQPRTANPQYTDSSNPYTDTGDFQSSGAQGYYSAPPVSSGQPSYQMPQGGYPGASVGSYQNPPDQRTGTTNRQDSAPRDNHRDRRPRR